MTGAARASHACPCCGRSHALRYSRRAALGLLAGAGLAAFASREGRAGVAGEMPGGPAPAEPPHAPSPAAPAPPVHPRKPRPLLAGLVEPHMRIGGSEPAGVRRFALTLDACSGGFDRRIADMLVAESIKATIFLTRRWIVQNPDGLAFLMAHGDLFELENHGAEHRPAVLDDRHLFGMAGVGDMAGLVREVEGGAEAVRAGTGRRPVWFRDASAFYSPAAIPEIRRLGFAIAGFSLNADFGASLPAATVAARIAQAKSGDVIIGHVNQPHRPAGAGIAAGVLELKRSGALFVRLDEVTTVPVK